MSDETADGTHELTLLEQADEAPDRFGLQLLIIGDGLIDSHELPASGQLTIGRSSSCDLKIDLPLVSRHHATLLLDETIRIRDENSANGTVVRNKRLDSGATTELRTGDVVELGSGGSATLIIQQRSRRDTPRRLWSHDYFEGRLEEECARSSRTGALFAVLRLRVASRPQRPVEQRLLDVLRASDSVARYGPDDFEMLLPDTDPPRAEHVAARLCESVETAGADAHVGVACFPSNGRTAAELMEFASSQVASQTLDEATEIDVGVMQRLHRLVERIAVGSINVLLLGETGVGKEVFAEQIHRLSNRAHERLLRLNCAAFTETLLESELFGHEKGAFTGADKAKPGLLETADGGTVFLDEIGDLPLPLQAKLLRVLEERSVMRVGTLEARAIDVRFIAATHRDLEAEIARGRFRQDLYFRLNGVTLVIPPLRERTDEIEPLARSFLRQAARAMGAEPPDFSDEALALLTSYSWPGNVRELRNAMERAQLLCTGGRLRPEHLPLEKMRATVPVAAGKPPRRRETRATDLRLGRDEAERKMIVDALEATGGNQTKAAQLLGISRRTLINRLDKYGIERPRKKT